VTAVKLEDTLRVVSAAEKKAAEIGQPMNIAVADEGGNIVAHVRMDNAWIGSIDISLKKAYTSRAFDIETKELAKHSQSGGEFFGIHVSEQRQNHGFRRRHPAEGGWQGGRGDWRQRWFGRSGSCRCCSRRRRVLAPRTEQDCTKRTNPCRTIIPAPTSAFPKGTPDWTSPICTHFRNLETLGNPS
jgi:uncharacterized protein GlcG (DUF336 family)